MQYTFLPRLLPIAFFLTRCDTDESLQACLPDGVDEKTVINVITTQSPNGLEKVNLTVGNRLKELGARCPNCRLIDPGGRRIDFLRKLNRWDAPPRKLPRNSHEQVEDLKNTEEIASSLNSRLL